MLKPKVIQSIYGWRETDGHKVRKNSSEMLQDPVGVREKYLDDLVAGVGCLLKEKYFYLTQDREGF